jgi:hypothetical protein
MDPSSEIVLRCSFFEVAWDLNKDSFCIAFQSRFIRIPCTRDVSFLGQEYAYLLVHVSGSRNEEQNIDICF